jgi:hypothetical protein
MRFQPLFERGGEQEFELEQGFIFHDCMMDNICP